MLSSTPWCSRVSNQEADMKILQRFMFGLVVVLSTVATGVYAQDEAPRGGRRGPPPTEAEWQERYDNASPEVQREMLERKAKWKEKFDNASPEERQKMLQRRDEGQGGSRKRPPRPSQSE